MTRLSRVVVDRRSPGVTLSGSERLFARDSTWMCVSLREGMLVWSLVKRGRRRKRRWTGDVDVPPASSCDGPWQARQQGGCVACGCSGPCGALSMHICPFPCCNDAVHWCSQCILEGDAGDESIRPSCSGSWSLGGASIHADIIKGYHFPIINNDKERILNRFKRFP